MTPPFSYSKQITSPHVLESGVNSLNNPPHGDIRRLILITYQKVKLEEELWPLVIEAAMNP
jgi:hypothetical protein